VTPAHECEAIPLARQFLLCTSGSLGSGVGLLSAAAGRAGGVWLRALQMRRIRGQLRRRRHGGARGRRRGAADAREVRCTVRR